MSPPSICIHGHFYQPPRENPWLEAIELQDSAAPFHDWNARIAAECYGPNAAARVLDAQERVVRIVNNYARMSFNFGPTLLDWLEAQRPDIYHAILRADREGAARFSGHGPAMAQVYNHVIMPLASPRDRRVQVRWGLDDFRRRFGRDAEGMWLAETAVCIDTLSALAEQGVIFTLLAPHQAARVRPLDEPDAPWQEVHGHVDTTKPYLQRLPDGRQIVIYFYNGPISQAIAFERLLTRGEHLAARMVGAVDPHKGDDQLVHIATDGETYGHHHRHGEMALAYALDEIERGAQARLTVYGEHLAQHPPRWEVEIAPNTAWSCAHGVERWRADCGCCSGGKPGWHQRWRAPLRGALDWLRDQVALCFELRGARLFKDREDALLDYSAVLSGEGRRAFIARHAREALEPAQQVEAISLLEMQRHAQLMYTSCGWFFDDMGGIETVQILQYAGRVIQLHEALGEPSLEAAFIAQLTRAEGNQSELPSGAEVYTKQVAPARITLQKVCEHHAISALFEPREPLRMIACYEVREAWRRVRAAGQARLLVGRAEITSTITLRRATFTYAVLHMGDHNVTGGILPTAHDETSLEGWLTRAEALFERAEYPALIRGMDQVFAEHVFSLRSLFRDDQRRIIELILDAALRDAHAVYRQLYERRAPLMSYLTSLSHPQPPGFRAAAQVALDQSLDALLRAPDAPQRRAEVRAVLKAARAAGITLALDQAGHRLTAQLNQRARALAARPSAIDALDAFAELLALVDSVPAEVDLWEAQNAYALALTSARPEALASRGEPWADAWLARFDPLAAPLRINLLGWRTGP